MALDLLHGTQAVRLEALCPQDKATSSWIPHLDLAWKPPTWNRDLRLPVRDSAAASGQGDYRQGRGNSPVLPSMPCAKERSASVIATLLARLLRRTSWPAHSAYESMESAHAAAHGQLAYYRRWRRGLPALHPMIVRRWGAHVIRRQRNAIHREPSLILTWGRPIRCCRRSMCQSGTTPVRIQRPAHYGPSPTPASRHGRRPVRARAGPAAGGWSTSAMILEREIFRRLLLQALNVRRGPVLAIHHTAGRCDDPDN